MSSPIIWHCHYHFTVCGIWTQVCSYKTKQLNQQNQGMVKLFIFKHVIRNGLLARNVFSFVPLNDNIGLPFPLYVSYAWKTLLASSFLLTLFEGSRLRKITISYMLSREANLGPINLLIWVDQVTIVFQAHYLWANFTTLNTRIFYQQRYQKCKKNLSSHWCLFYNFGICLRKSWLWNIVEIDSMSLRLN